MTSQQDPTATDVLDALRAATAEAAPVAAAGRVLREYRRKTGMANGLPDNALIRLRSDL